MFWALWVSPFISWPKVNSLITRSYSSFTYKCPFKYRIPRPHPFLDFTTPRCQECSHEVADGKPSATVAASFFATSSLPLLFAGQICQRHKGWKSPDGFSLRRTSSPRRTPQGPNYVALKLNSRLACQGVPNTPDGTCPSSGPVPSSYRRSHSCAL
jgi:hypothetical protein